VPRASREHPRVKERGQAGAHRGRHPRTLPPHAEHHPDRQAQARTQARARATVRNSSKTYSVGRPAPAQPRPRSRRAARARFGMQTGPASGPSRVRGRVRVRRRSPAPLLGVARVIVPLAAAPRAAPPAHGAARPRGTQVASAPPAARARRGPAGAAHGWGAAWRVRLVRGGGRGVST